MAKKTLESDSKRKAEIEQVDLTGDEVLNSLTTNKKKIDSNKKPKPSKDSNKNAKTSKKTEDPKKKAKEVKQTDKKVKFESPVKRSDKKDEVEVKKVKKSKVNKEEVADENENGALYVFPMNRVTRIVKSENSDVKLSAEAAFLFNKASEKFLELFSKEAYSCASKDGKKKIEYQHLSSLIPETKDLTSFQILFLPK